MTKERILHWVEDDDRLDAYLRREIPEDKRGDLDAHIAECPRCAAKLRREQKIREGIRAFGRNEKKQELRNMLKARKDRWIMPYRWVAAAATVVLAVAVWYIPGEEPMPVVDSEIPIEDADEVDSSKPMQVPSSELPEIGERRDAPAEEAAAPASRDAAAGAGLTDEKEGKVPELRALAPAVSKSVPGLSWRLGQQRRRNNGIRAQKLEAPRAAAQFEEAEEAVRADEQLSPQKIVIVTQQRFTEADTRIQALSMPQTDLIPVLYRETADSLFVTLFVRTPIPEAELRDVRVRAFAPDSLRILAGSQEFVIGRKLSQELQ